MKAGCFFCAVKEVSLNDEKQKRFVEEYLIDLNATRAYRVAYTPVKKDETARANAADCYRMLTLQRIFQSGCRNASSVLKLRRIWSSGNWRLLRPSAIFDIIKSNKESTPGGEPGSLKAWE